MTKNNQELIWVNKEFKKLLKQKAIEYDCSVLKLSEMIAKNQNLDELKRKKNDFRF